MAVRAADEHALLLKKQTLGRDAGSDQPNVGPPSTAGMIELPQSAAVVQPSSASFRAAMQDPEIIAMRNEVHALKAILARKQGKAPSHLREDLMQAQAKST